MNKKQHRALADFFEAAHANPLPPLNPKYLAHAAQACREVVDSMEADGFYDLHTRDECATEYRKRLDLKLAEYNSCNSAAIA